MTGRQMSRDELPPRVPDGCEWEPSENRPAFDTDTHYRTTPATWIVGSRVSWRVCDRCADLTRFLRYRRRLRIER